jgi:CrcB protein
LSETRFLIDPAGRIFLMTGFCGAFTTFSTYILESIHLMRGGEFLRAFTNLSASVVLGLLACWGGMLLGEIL